MSGRRSFFAAGKLLASGWVLMISTAIAEPPIAKLQRLQQAALRSLQANDREAAAATATVILSACAVPTDSEDDKADVFAKDDPRRIEFLLFAARLDVGIGNLPRAWETFRAIVADAAPDSIDRLQAEAFLLKAKIESGEDYLDDSIRLLARSSQLTDAQQGLRDECQDLVLDGIISTTLADAIENPQLAEHLADIEKKMVDAGVPVGVARLTRFAAAVNSSRSDRSDLLETQLNELKNVITEKEVTAYRRAQYWNLVAGLQVKRRHYAEAFDACREFELNIRQTGRMYQAAIARDQTALVALLIGDYAEARKAFESTRPVHTSTMPVTSEQERLVRLENATTWRVNLAFAMEGDNEFLPARTLLQEAARTLENDREKVPKLVALVDNCLGLNFYLTGEFDTAAELFSRNKVLIQTLAGADDIYGLALVNAGWVAFGRGELELAANSFAEAADYFAAHLTTEHPRFAEALTYMARVAAARGQTRDARQWIEQAEALVYQRICRDLAQSQSAQDRLALVQEARVHPESIAWPGTIDTYLELATALKIPPSDQYDVVLRWKGLVQRLDQSNGSQHSTFAAAEREINAKLREAYFRKVSFLRRRALQQEIEDLESRLRQIQRASRSQRDADLSVASPTASEVAHELGDGDLFLDVFQIRTFRPPSRQALVGSARQYVAFALRSDGRLDRLSFGSVDELDSAIVRWGNTITQRSHDISADKRSEHQQLLKAAAEEVAQFVQRPILELGIAPQRILIRPDGATHLIPWAALPGVDGKQYWIENIRLQICNSTNFTKFEQPRPLPQADLAEQPESLLVVGGIDFGKLTMYPALPGSLTEKRHVAELFRMQFRRGTVVDLEHGAATEATLLQDMPGKDFIHLATHGFYHRRDATDVFGVTGATTLLQTGLVVAPPIADDPGHDQFLTAAELSEIDLSHTSLVMLSACESSLGQTLAGQGVQGMLGSFHAAGAARVVGTLWIVDDLATVSMTDRFYQQLWQQQITPADALRAAQLEMIHTPSDHSDAELLSHPYAWAAFICSAK